MDPRHSSRVFATVCCLALATIAAPPSASAAANKPPVVSLTSPAQGAVFALTATITVSATASDPTEGGSVTKVAFYAGGTLIGTSTKAPYSVTWKDFDPGYFTMTAVATDNQGATTTSSPVAITIKKKNGDPPNGAPPSNPAPAPAPAPPAQNIQNSAPSVSITAPSAGAVYANPAVVTIAASASDSNGSIAKVEFFAGNTLVGTATSAPYSATWRQMDAGTYALTAVATDNAGTSTRSNAVSITITPIGSNAAPTVTLTAPAGGTSYTAPATIAINAAASDSNGTIAKVEFFAGVTLVGSAATSPYTTTWRNVPAGTYTLTALATDNGGTTGRSAPVTVTVTGAAGPPTVTLTSPSTGALYSDPATIALSATAADSSGAPVKRVDFYEGATLIASTTTAPYALPWSGVPEGTYTVTAVATDVAGLTARSAPVNVTVNAPANLGPLASLPLLQPRSLQYEGAFRVPDTSSNGTSFAYGGTGLAFNPSHNSLFAVGHATRQMANEFSIPGIAKAPSPSGLPRASMLQTFNDPTDGKMYTLLNPSDPNAKIVGGLLVDGNRLISTAYSFYDGSGTQTVSHFVSGLDLGAKGDAQGPFPTTAPKAGMVSGYMGAIPPEWQQALGGSAIAGNCCLSIISRTSFGPAAFAFNPSDVGAASPIPMTPLVYYPSTHPTLGDYGQNSALFGAGVAALEMKGVVFPEGTRTVLFFGRQGTGAYCYGQGTVDKTLDRKPNPAAGQNEIWCYDPEAPMDKGVHGYPYRHIAVAYDALDLAEVKAGARQPWDVTPYAVWPISFPYSAWFTRLYGATYDPATSRIYLSQGFGDNDMPVIHVYTVVP